MRASAKKMLAQGPVEGKWDLPVGWEWRRLGEVCPANRKKIHPATKPELPYIGMEHIEPHTGAQCGQDIFGHMKSTGVHFFRGDVLYGRLRPYLSKVFLARHEGACSPEFIVFEENNSLSNKYLGYFLRSGDFVNFASHPDNTSGERPRIDYDTIAAHPIPLPPTVQDQERIVERIDSLFAELDKAEETLRHTITLCEQYKQSVLKAAVTGELSKEWRRTNPPKETGEQLLQRILKERRAAWEKAELTKMTAKGQKPTNDNWKKKYKEPQAPDTSGLPELPEGWTWASMEQLTSIITSGSRGWADYYAESGAIFIRAQDIKTDSLVLDTIAYVALPENSEGMRTRVSASDILITVTGANVTKTALVKEELDEAYVSQHVALCRPVLPVLAPYLYLWIVCPTDGRKQLESLAYGAGKPGLSLENIKGLVMPLPPLVEFEVMARKMTDLLAQNECCHEFIINSYRRINDCKQSILKRAFCGGL